MQSAPVLSIRTVANLLKVKVYVVKRWAADGRLPPDGEKCWFPPGMPHMGTNGPFWLPETVAAVQDKAAVWREEEKERSANATVDLSSQVPQDIVDLSRALLCATETKVDDQGRPLLSLYRLRRALAKFIEFADLATEAVSKPPPPA